MTTLDRTLARGAPGPGGYRRLVEAAGEPHLVRRELGGAPGERLIALCTFVHLTDIHVTDVQSPARAEFLDRFGDLDSPVADQLGRVGVYRAQEALTVQVAEAMARAVRDVEHGPVLGMPIEFALSTGDATDNCQLNELDAYVALLDGGVAVSIDSGDRTRFEGVGATGLYDRRYWHPEGTPAGESDDFPRERYGFPTVPGLHDAARVPLLASGLGLPWYAIYGNHDALFGGTLPQQASLRALAVGDQKRVGVAEDFDPLPLLLNNEVRPPELLWALLEGPSTRITADERRRPISRSEWIAGHIASPGSPAGHGFDADAAARGVAYYAFDRGPVRFLVLDTVNSAGGWQGSIDDAQFNWLEHELVAGHRHFARADGGTVEHDATDRIFVLVSHHTFETLINGFSPDGARRRLREDVAALISRFPNVVCWVNGHTHVNAVDPVADWCWQLTTASHIDWPQQSRIIELAYDEASGELVIISSMLDHAGLLDGRSAELDDPLTLAGWSRELAANAWQGRIDGVPIGAGRTRDRNVICTVPLSFRPVMTP